MSKKKKKRKNQERYKFMVVGIFFLVILLVFWKAPNYQMDLTPKQTIRLIYNTEELTAFLNQDIFLDEQGEIYVSLEDVKAIWDADIYFDAENNQIVTTTDKKLATMKVGENQLIVNSSKVETYATIQEKDGVWYLPIQEFRDVYNLDIRYVTETNTITVDNLEERYLVANSKKTMGIKSLKDSISRNVDHVQKGDMLILDIEQDLNEKWIRVRTQKGKVGYVKKNQISNVSTVRDNMLGEKQIAGDVYLFIDEFASAAQAPNRAGEPLDQKVNAVAPTMLRIQRNNQTNLRSNIGTAGTRYVTWAHNKGYKIWPMLTNPDMAETTASVLKNYASREKLINNIVSAIVKYNFDGITIRFEKVEDTENLIHFIEELAPRMREMGKVLVFDTTRIENMPLERIEKKVDYVIKDNYQNSKMILL